MLDIQDGTLRLHSGMALTPTTLADPAALHGFEDCGATNGLRLLSTPAQLIWDKHFTVNLRFEGEKLHFIELLWNDGPVNRLGYDATEKVLLDEKQQLTTMLTEQLGSPPADTSPGADYFPFPWGLVSARADQRSTACSVVVDYFYHSI